MFPLSRVAQNPRYGGRQRSRPDYGVLVTTNRVLAGVLVLATVAMAIGGEVLVLTHTGGAIGLLFLACGAAAGVVAWVTIGAPRTRADMRA